MGWKRVYSLINETLITAIKLVLTIFDIGIYFTLKLAKLATASIRQKLCPVHLIEFGRLLFVLDSVVELDRAIRVLVEIFGAHCLAENCV